MREGEYISDHDAKVATHVARILTGGEITPGTLLSEQYLLDLERQAFLSLCGEAKDAGENWVHLEDREAATELRDWQFENLRKQRPATEVVRFAKNDEC